MKLNTDVTPELKQALEDLRRMIANADGILTNNVAVTLKQVDTTLEELRAPIARRLRAEEHRRGPPG